MDNSHGGFFRANVYVENIDASRRDVDHPIQIICNNNSSSVLGGAGKDTILGDLANDILRGGKGDDCITGGSGNDTLRPQTSFQGWETTLYGGAGNDVFYCHREFDPTNIILDYTEGEDIIRFGNRMYITSYSIDGFDVFATFKTNVSGCGWEIITA